MTLRRSGDGLPSRIIDNVLWMGRYAERAEVFLRLLRSLVVRALDDSGLTGSAAFSTLLRAMESAWELPGMHAVAAARPALGSREAHVLQTMLCDTALPNSVCASLSALHRATARVRDYMTLEG